MKKDEVKRLFDNVAKFGFDEFARLFQNVANKEYISLTSKSNNSKEPITLNANMIKFNPENLEVNSSVSNSMRHLLFNDESNAIDLNSKSNIDIGKIIIKNPKEKNIIKEKFSGMMNDNKAQGSNKKKDSNVSIPQQQSQSVLGTKEYFESITQNIKSILNNKVVDLHYLKNVIKLYSTFIHSNNKLIEQEDQLLLSLLTEVLVSSSSYEDFFELCNYWLYTEFLLSNEANEYYRYDTLLNDIITLIDNNRFTNLQELMDSWSSSWVKFISQIPRYNSRFIDHILSMHDLYFKTNYDLLKKQSYEKMQFNEQLPHLMSLRQIYIEIVNERKISPNDRLDFRKKLLDKFIQMSRNDYNHLNARAINFLFSSIYNISKHIDHFEEYRIRTLAIEGLKELLRITDDSIEDEHSKKTFIEQRFPLYLHLCGKENEVIDELPEVYASSCQLVKQIFDRYMKLMMNNINIFRAKQIITKCDDRCEEIVIAIIDIFYNKTNRNEERIKEDGLFIKIGSYYMKYYQLTKGVIALCTRISLRDYFVKENFILNKLNGNTNTNVINNDELSMKIIGEIDRNDSVAIYNVDSTNIDKELLGNVKHKVLIYIAGYYWYSGDNGGNGNVNSLLVLMKYYFKLFVPLSNDERLNEFDAFCRFMLGVNYPLLCFIELFKGILDFIKTSNNNNSNGPLITKENTESINMLVYVKIAFVLNEKKKNSFDEFNDNFYDRFIAFIKNEHLNSGFKENLLMKLEDAIKVSLQGKDLIMFGDL